MLEVLENHGVFHKGKSMYSLRMEKKSTYQQGGYEIYNVQNGDTLYSISKEFGVTIEQLKRLNRLVSDIIDAGFPLKIKLLKNSGETSCE